MLRNSFTTLAVVMSILSLAPIAPAATRYVSPCGNDAWGGGGADCQDMSPALRPMRTIQGAINTSSDNDHIIVLPGTYAERINFLGRALVVRSQDGPAVTIIDATGLPGSAVVFDIVPEATPVFRGFTVTGGTGEVLPGFGNLRGGGLRISGSIGVDVIDCIFRDNNVGQACCTLGGGMYVENGAGPRFINCISYNNSPNGLQTYQGSPALINCTISGNATHGIIADGPHIWVYNTISWGNGFGNMAQIGATAFHVFNSCYPGAQPVNGNISADPLFANAAAGDFRLISASPAIDAGNDALVPGTILTDIAGNARFINGNATPAPTVDIGAHEFQPNACPADTNGSNSVDVDDLVAVILGWGTCPTPPAPCDADVTDDSQVNVDDLVTVILEWGACP